MKELSPETVVQLTAQLERAQRDGAISVASNEAVAEAAFLVAAADGNVAALELAHFAEVLEQAFGTGMDGDPRALLASFQQRLAEHGLQARFEAIGRAIGGAPAAETALRAAATVAFVDDQVHAAEAAVLESLRQALRIDEERAQAILAEVHAELFGD